MSLDAVAGHVEPEPDGFDVIIIDEASQVGIYGALRQRGFTVKPRFVVRDGHIDLGVIGDRGRLAVACDAVHGS